MSELEEFYNEYWKKQFPNDKLPEFSELSDDQKKIENSLAFSRWKFGNAKMKLNKEMRNRFNTYAESVDNFCKALKKSMENIKNYVDNGHKED